MPVVSNPIYNPTSAYQPILYNVFYTATPDIVKYCEFKVFVNGTSIGIGRKVYYATNAAFGSVEYYFDIDIQEYLQRWLAPNRNKSSMFGALGAATQVDNIDAYADVYVEFRYLILSATTGKIYEAPSFDTSDIRVVDMATRQNGEARSFSEFIWTPPSVPARFLSNMPIQQSICRNGNAFISFMSGWNWMRLQTFNSSGIQITDSYAPTGGSTTVGHTTVGAGIAQLQNVVWFNGMNPNFTGAVFYGITFGVGIIATPTTIFFIGNQIQKLYKIEDCCSKKLKLFWLNRLGGVDNFDFCYTDLQQKTESQVFEKALSWPHLQSDFGKSATNIKAERSYAIQDKVKNLDMDWLRELFASAEIYIQNPDGSLQYWRVTIPPASFLEKKNKGVVDIEFEVLISQDVVTHRI